MAPLAPTPDYAYVRVRAHFKNIDEIITTIKAATIK